MRDDQAKAYVRTLVLAALLGFPVAFAAVLFQTAIHDLTHVVWEVIPDELGWSEPAWWYVILVTGLAGLLVAAAVRLPGHGGHSPLEGLGAEAIPPIALTSILTAALATLGLGLVLGPEAPLIALGLGLGALTVRMIRLDGTGAQLLVFAGSFAAIAALFGGPLVAAFLLFEVTAASGKIPAQQIGRALLPGFVAAGTGALVFTGVVSRLNANKKHRQPACRAAALANRRRWQTQFAWLRHDYLPGVFSYGLSIFANRQRRK